MMRLPWVTTSLLLTLFASVVRCQSQSCIRSAFPDTSGVREIFDGTATGNQRHLQYVDQLFRSMNNVKSNCSADATKTRATFTSIPDPVFADGLQSRQFKYKEAFSVANAQLLTNLVLTAPPTTNTASTSKRSYCYAERSGQCTECNIWQNSLYYDSHLKATLETNADATAAGFCFRTGASTLRCREANSVSSKNVTISPHRDLTVDSSCSEPWLWHKPQEVFNVAKANNSFLHSDNTEIVKTKYQANRTVHYVTRNTSAWSNIVSQCYKDGRTEWAHINTVPVIAVCTARLALAGLCRPTESGQLVMIGSSWLAFSLRSTYNITQCPVAASGPKQDVFVGSAKCGQASIAGNATESLQCVNRLIGFEPHSYACTCPGARHLVESQQSNTVTLPGGRVSYLGSYIASQTQRTNVSISTCQACQAGCRSCIDGSACLRTDSLGLRAPILVISILVLIVIIVLVLYVQRITNTNLIQSAAPVYLMGILVSAVIASLEAFILFPRVNNTICALQPWPRHIAFIGMFGFLFGKLWRVQILARLPPGRIQMRTLDAGIQRFVFILSGLMLLYLILWTAIGRSEVEIVYDDLDQSYSRCSVDYWRYVIHGVELIFLLIGCVVALVTRRLVYEWTEFKFLLGAFANAAVIKALIAVFYFTLMPNKYSDYLYLLQFFDNFFTVNLSLIIIFGHKIYMVQRSKGDRGIGPTVPSKVSRKESNPELNQVQEVSLQQIAEGRRESDPTGKRQQEFANAGVFDLMCGCICGPLSAEWGSDYYGTKEKKKAATSIMKSSADADEPSINTTDLSTNSAKESSKGSTDDSGLPYMGDNN